MKKYTLLFAMALSYCSFGQHQSDEILDSLFIEEIENIQTPDKVLHAEPLFIDLIRDLGARKGEKEWNVGFGLTDNNTFDSYAALVEYEWAPVNRLGLELELPFTFYYASNEKGSTPRSKLNGVKAAIQYSFFVSEKWKTSLAVGHIQEFELIPFHQYGKHKLFSGNVFSPFVVAAKRWRTNFHSLIYSGPIFNQHFEHKEIGTSWQINSNLHYMISGTRNFVGIEFNKMVSGDSFNMVLRPQMRVSISDNLLMGIVTGISLSKDNERFSTFFRMIYEPKHRSK